MAPAGVHSLTSEPMTVTFSLFGKGKLADVIKDFEVGVILDDSNIIIRVLSR